MTQHQLHINLIEQDFLKQFNGDTSWENVPKQSPNDLYCLVKNQEFPNAKLQHFNAPLAQDLGLDICPEKDFSWLAGQLHNSGVNTYATAYAGHQFGQWAGQLGDGRAILLGDILGHEWQWKGLGLTPYSRHADGRAVWRSSLREYLMSEAMHYLKVPTTRALALVDAGDKVWRDPMYNGQTQQEPAAIVLRVAQSFVRFGHLELLAARQQKDTLQKLCLWLIERYFPMIDSKKSPKTQILAFFTQIAQTTQSMILDWLRVGFCHGVMNTDNMSVLGLTIDYGPFGMMDAYQKLYTPNTSDAQGRYAFIRQSQMAFFNLNALANALMVVLEDKTGFDAVLQEYATSFKDKYLNMMRQKFGLCESQAGDQEMLELWDYLMEEMKIDYTLFFTLLADVDQKTDVLKHFEPAFYQKPKRRLAAMFLDFIKNYLLRLEQNSISKTESRAMMQAANPKFILRNHLLYEAYQGLLKNDDYLLKKLFEALQNPYEIVHPELHHRAPDWAKETVGCNRLSCSS